MTTEAGTTTLVEQLRSYFERQDFTGLDELYSDDAVLELYVGTAHDVYRGRPAIVARYTEDYASPATFLRWDVRQAPWGAVVEAAAVQGDGLDKVFFRWAHLLGIDNGRISTDTVYCTGAVPAASACSRRPVVVTSAFLVPPGEAEGP
jgi:ketosteroid isomerase-like protein